MPDLVFSGRPAGRPVYAPLRERAAPPPGDLPGTRPAPRRSAFRAPRAWLGSSAPSPRPPWRWPPSLRYASARRRRRGLPGSRPAPRRSACRARGPGSDPWSPSPRSPRVRSSSPRHGCARRRRRARARRPARGPTTSLPGPGGPGSHSRRLPPFSTPLFALAAGWAAAMPSMLTRDHHKGGGRVPLPRSPPPAEGGRGRGRAPTRQAPCWPGTEGEGSGAVPISLHPGCARCAAPPFRNIIHPAWDNRCRRCSLFAGSLCH